VTHILEDFKEFLNQSPTSYHAVRELSERLASQDFQPLDEQESWDLKKGERYFTIRGGSLCAFSLPSSTLEKATILGSHTDCPALKIKPHPDYISHNMSLVGAEVYGSPMLSSWLNRDLCIAGRIIVSDAHDNLEEKLVWLDDAPLCIPQLAIHLDREVNDKGLILNKQEHLSPLAGLCKENDEQGAYLERVLRRHIKYKNLYSFDLFLVPMEPARFLGEEGEFISSYHLDNLASAHACVTAMALNSKVAPNHLSMAMFWDHEEIGSRTIEGAASPFLNDVLRRINALYRLDEESFIRFKNKSFCLSLDVSHGFNPNYKNKYEPHHLPLLGKGIVLKYNADHKYASSALTAALIAQKATALQIPYQSYVTRSDMNSGSTVGPIVAHQMGIPTVDIGVPLLSMHSIREVIACSDQLDMYNLLTAILE
jgi:aspartyl aminopeptidase